MSTKRGSNIKNPEEIDLLLETAKPNNFNTAVKMFSPSPQSYLIRNKKSFSQMNNAVRGVEYENSVLNHMENLKKRHARHATVNDISQLYASDIS